jgi:hypothetical protein
VLSAGDTFVAEIGNKLEPVTVKIGETATEAL